MKKCIIRKRSMAAVLAAALLLCGCSCSDGGSDWDGDIDLAGDISENDIAPVTTTTTSKVTDMTITTTTPEIVAEPETVPAVIVEYVYATDENGVESFTPVEYKLYHKDWETGESTLLFDHVKTDSAFYEDITYAVVDNGEQTPFMIAYRENEGDIDVVTAYTAQYGELEILGFIDDVKDDDGKWQRISEILGHTMIVIRDGDHILRSFCNDMDPQFEELFILENGIYDYDQPQSVYKEAYHFAYTASYAKNEFLSIKNGYMLEYTDEMMMEYFGHTLDDFYICPECGDGYEYFIWADKDRQFYWYHPETGVNEPIELIGDLNYDVFIAKGK